MMDDNIRDLNEKALEILNYEKGLADNYKDRLTPIFLKWRGNLYIAQMLEIVPLYSKDIISLRKEEEPVEDDLVRAIKSMCPRAEFEAGEHLNLEDTPHILSISGCRLIELSADQQNAIWFYFADPVNKKPI